jgi:uncharacterized protein (DUF342 family)
MDARYYCSTMTSDLVGLKARIYDIITTVEKSPNKDKLYSQLTSLHAMVYDLQSKIEKLNKECPADWSATKQEIEKKKQELLKQIDIWDTAHIAGGYVGG